MKKSILFKREISLLVILSMLLSLCAFCLPMTMVSAEATEEILISKNAQWKYEDTNTDLYTPQFYTESYTDTAWQTGKAPLGYPLTDSNPTFGLISDGTLVNNVNKPNAIITYYFRNSFTITDLASVTGLKATIGFDDGFIMYVNGTEVNRTYVDSGIVTHATTANYVNEPSTSEGTVNLDLSSSLSVLREGTNVIAISVHNRDADSSDIYFDMILTAEKGGDSNPADENELNPNFAPKQVNVHMGDDPSTSVNFTYTTLAETTTKVVINKLGDTDELTFGGTNSVGSGNKYIHAIPVTGLKPNTTYEYTVGNGENTFGGKFKTAPEKGSKYSFKFAYLADTQVANAIDAKALGATLDEVNKTEDLSFVYLAGDVTDTSTNEAQWEQLFNNNGAFPNGGQDMFANNLISVIQGNHDNNTMNRHINAPAQEGNIVYSYDYGSATFVMLNLETARYDATARGKQLEFLTAKVDEAKARGQWVIAGFHKSLYTGASHITDADIIEARKYWCPVLAQLDVDFVLQGHDHVYSRGFVNADGSRAYEQAAVGTVEDPKNAPLYMVGGHAGGLKWYSKKNYTVGTGDPLIPGYSFLDKNSTDDQSDVKKEQVIVELDVSDMSITINAYMFKYDTTTDTITTPKYLYDTLTITKSPEATIAAENVTAAKNSSVNVPITLQNADKVGRLKATVNYDKDLLVIDDVTLTGFDIQACNTDEEGIIVFEAIKQSGLKASDKTVIANLNFTIKGDITEVTQTSITFADIEANSSEIVAGENPAPLFIVYENGTVTILDSYLGDLSGNDSVDGEDALMLLQYLSALRQFTNLQLNLSNFNSDEEVDTADVLGILNYSVSTKR